MRLAYLHRDLEEHEVIFFKEYSTPADPYLATASRSTGVITTTCGVYPEGPRAGWDKEPPLYSSHPVLRNGH